MIEDVDAPGEESVKIASLFSGAGGLDIGFCVVPVFETVLHLDIDETAVESLRANQGPGEYVHKDATVIEGDIRKFVTDLEAGDHEAWGLSADYADRVDLLIGGPPCQPFSAAARRTGGTEGTDSDEGQLFEAYVDLLRLWQPTGFLFENVYGITANEEDWRPIVEAFNSAGYEVTERTLDAADYGAPQHRERTFIVGVHQDEAKANGTSFLFPRPTHGPDSNTEQELRRVQDALNSEISLTGVDKALFDGPIDSTGAADDPAYEITSKHAHLLDDIPTGLNYSFYTEKLGHPDPVFGWRSRFSDYLYKADPETPVRTLKAQPGAASGPFHWENRKFTEAELKRLQSFPDDYELRGSYGDVVRQIGNSVPPTIATPLAWSIAHQLFGLPEDEVPAEIELMDDDFDLGYRSRKRTSSEEYQRKARERLQDLGLWEPSQERASSQHGLEDFEGGSAPDAPERTDEKAYSVGISGLFDRVVDPGDSTGHDHVYSVESAVVGPTLEMAIEETTDEPSVEFGILAESDDGDLLPGQNVSRISITAGVGQLSKITEVWAVAGDDIIERSNYEKLIDVVGHYSTTRRDYTSRLTVDGDLDIDEATTAALQYFSQASNCNREITLADLATSLDHPPDAVVAALQQLREWRYEIRTPTTHGTMRGADGEPASVLCTYPFPDLEETSHFDPSIELRILAEEAEQLRGAGEWMRGTTPEPEG